MTMMTIAIDKLPNVLGAQQLAPGLSGPRDILRARLPPVQPPADPARAELAARMAIAAEIRQARPWMTPEQAKDPKFVGSFMQPWY
jgi:hypothetical protein